jgi:hypothetical protein
MSGSGAESRRESCQGIARIRCSPPQCRLEYFRPFSYRGFHSLGGPLHRLCPSCSQKRLSRRSLIELIPTLPGTLVIASHYLDLTFDPCDRAIVLGGGRVACGPARRAG